MGEKGTSCKQCNRFLWEKDADKNGLCEDCRAKPEAPKKKEAKDKE